MELTLADVARVAGGSAFGESGPLTAYATDSRLAAAGTLFFALRGAELDGHEFVADAARRGAAAAVVERRLDLELPQVVVGSSWKALFDLATHALRVTAPLALGVTGSNGKTSTKEMVAAVLAERFNVLRTQGNLNTETGVPLTILALEPHHSALVLEMGLQRAGDIARLAALAKPAIGIVTNVGVVHLEFFESREHLARGKGELVASLPEQGLAVLNADNEFYPLLAAMTVARVATFGVERGDYRVEDFAALPGGGSRFSVRGAGVTLSLDGRHQALNAAAALAAGDFAGVPVADGAAALSRVVVDHRLQEIPAPAGFVIVDDAYNASPESMLAAFDVMAAKPREGRLLAVLGEMRELGALADESHRRVGARAREVFDAACVVDAGPHARLLAEAATAELVADRGAAAAWVRANARAGDRVLVKASHGVGLDLLVEELTSA